MILAEMLNLFSFQQSNSDFTAKRVQKRFGIVELQYFL